MEGEPALDRSRLVTRQDRVRLQRAVELIRENLDAELSVGVIARGAGVSASCSGCSGFRRG